jgi:hypothetical protein
MRKTILTAVLIAAAAFGAGCNDNSTPPAPPRQMVTQSAPVAPPAQVNKCAGAITVGKDETPPCDMHRPQELNVTGVDKSECDDMGGQFDAPNAICVDVDY